MIESSFWRYPIFGQTHLQCLWIWFSSVPLTFSELYYWTFKFLTHSHRGILKRTWEKWSLDYHPSVYCAVHVFLWSRFATWQEMLRSASSRSMKSTPGTSNMWDLGMAPMSRSPLSLRRGTSNVGRSIRMRNCKTHQDLQISFRFHHPFDHPISGVSYVFCFFPRVVRWIIFSDIYLSLWKSLESSNFVYPTLSFSPCARSTWSRTMLGCRRWKRNPAAPSLGC